MLSAAFSLLSALVGASAALLAVWLRVRKTSQLEKEKARRVDRQAAFSQFISLLEGDIPKFVALSELVTRRLVRRSSNRGSSDQADGADQERARAISDSLFPLGTPAGRGGSSIRTFVARDEALKAAYNRLVQTRQRLVNALALQLFVRLDDIDDSEKIMARIDTYVQAIDDLRVAADDYIYS